MKKVKSSPSARVPDKSASKSTKSRDAAKPVAQGKAAPKKAAAAIRAKAGSASPKPPVQKLPAMKKASATIKPAAPQPASVKPAIAPKKSAAKAPAANPATTKPAKPKHVKTGPATPPQVAVGSPLKPAPKPKSAAGRAATAKPKVESSRNRTVAASSGRKTSVKQAAAKTAAVKKAAVKKVSAKKSPAKKSVKKPSPKSSSGASASKPTSAAGVAGAPRPKLPPKKPALTDVPPILLEGDEPKRRPVAGPGTRFHLQEPDAPRDLSEDFDLPDAYGTGKLFLAARDPQWLHAHWDLTMEQLRTWNGRSRSGCLMLRVFGDGGLRQEINVHPEARTWFVHVGRGGLTYSVELGGYDRSGAWFTVAASERATTPPDSLAEEVEPEFAERETVADPAAEESISLRPIPPKIAAGNATSSEPPASQAEPATGTGTQPRREVGRRGFSQWSPAQAAAMEESVTMSAVKKTWGASGEITELLAQRRERALASAAAAGKSAAAAGIPEGASDKEALSSQAAVPAGDRPGFWFNVNAELIVYGATEPDARVTIGGRPVRLRPDGTFSFRFALPDGEYELPIEAVAADEHDGRRAELEFARATNYVGDVETHPQDPALKPPKPEHTS